MKRPTAPSRLVGVFGGSEVTSTDPLFRQAIRLGGALADAGFGLCTGGYGGIMEAACRGSREAGAEPVGVTCAEFGSHPANPYVAREIREQTLLGRTWRLIDLSAAFIIFPGKAGTLAELALLLALERAGLLAGKPRILLGPIWRDLLNALERARILEPGESERETIVTGPEAAIRALQENLGNVTVNELTEPLTALRPKGLIRDYFETIVTCVIFVVFSRAYVFQQSKIPTGSMIPTLLIGDYIMVNKYVYSPTSSGLEGTLLPVEEINRGDVIVFKYPEEPEKDYIKRIIGLPGETIEIRHCTVHIDGEPLEEPYKQHVNHFNCPWDYYPPTQIPDDSYFAMGDNRDQSKDSRAWGFVPRQYIKGRALLIWWSYEEEPGTWRHTNVTARVKSIAEKATHFLTRTRWSRSFKVIR